jgi:hypothetical protein
MLYNRRVLINVEHVNSPLGFLGFVQNSTSTFGFKIERVYFLTGVPKGTVRGLHGHLKLEQVIIPVIGSFDLKVINSFGEQNIRMDNPSKGFYIKQGSWRELSNFSSNSCCLVLASTPYDPDDYYFDRDNFLSLIHQKSD